jgi:hypothetical protein
MSGQCRMGASSGCGPAHAQPDQRQAMTVATSPGAKRSLAAKLRSIFRRENDFDAKNANTKGDQHFFYRSPLMLACPGPMKDCDLEVTVEGRGQFRRLSRPAPSFQDDPDDADCSVAAVRSKGNDPAPNRISLLPHALGELLHRRSAGQ